jgi:Beta-ketoacyl synthase, N-terminal domain
MSVMLKQGRLGAWIEAVGLLAPGIPDWSTGAKFLRAELPYQNAPTLLPLPQSLPAAERRRASRVIKLCIALGTEAIQSAGLEAKNLASVFSASNGDGHNIHAICEALAQPDRMVSPTRFHNSVHNAASGYWSIAAASMQASTVLAAFDATFSAGLLEAVVQVNSSTVPVLLLAYDSEYPEPILSKRYMPDAGGIALVLSNAPSERCLARIDVCVSQEGFPSTMNDAALESLRRSIPALEGLPLLAHLAQGKAATISLRYFSPATLTIEIHPC